MEEKVINSESKELQVLLELYKNTNQEIIQREKSEYDIPATFFGASSVILVIANSGLLTTQHGGESVILFALYSLALFIGTSGYHIYTMHSRTVAILQGYAARLEREINQKVNCESELAVRYSQYIDKFLIPQKFHTNFLSFALMAPMVGAAFVFISYLGAYQLYNSKLWFLIYIGVIAVCAVGLVVIVWDNVGNDRARRESEKG